MDDEISKYISGGIAPRRTKKSRQQLRRERKEAEEEALRQATLDEEAAAGPPEREIETESILKKLQPLGFAIVEMEPDGHCLFRAVSHQLKCVGREEHLNSDFVGIRKLCGDYLSKHYDDYGAFALGDDGEVMNKDEYFEYCKTIQNSSSWGGNMELQALSGALKVHIIVFQATGPNIEVGNDHGDEPLRLTYHRHFYTLGEHYNSVVTTLISE